MKTLEKKAEEIGQVNVEKGQDYLANIKAMSIKMSAYETLKGEDNRLGVYDMAEYSCDAGCKCCHCATY